MPANFEDLSVALWHELELAADTPIDFTRWQQILLRAYNKVDLHVGRDGNLYNPAPRDDRNPYYDYDKQRMKVRRTYPRRR